MWKPFLKIQLHLKTKNPKNGQRCWSTPVLKILQIILKNFRKSWKIQNIGKRCLKLKLVKSDYQKCQFEQCTRFGSPVQTRADSDSRIQIQYNAITPIIIKQKQIQDKSKKYVRKIRIRIYVRIPGTGCYISYDANHKIFIFITFRWEFMKRFEPNWCKF